MNIMSMNCVNCGAPIQVPPGIDQFACAHCGTTLIVQRGEGYVALKIAEQLSKAISDSGQQTRAAITEGTHVTQSELKSLQQKQDLSAAEMQLSNIQAEIRSLERQKKNGTIKKQLKQLRNQEADLKYRVNLLKLGVQKGGSTTYEMTREERDLEQFKQASKQMKSVSQDPLIKGCTSGCLNYFGMALLLATLAMPFDTMFFKWTFESGTGQPGPIAYVGMFIALIFGTVAFFYRWRKGVSVWVPIKAGLRAKRVDAKDTKISENTVGQSAGNQSGSQD